MADREKLLARLVDAFFRAAAAKVAAWGMDQLARLSVLEGAAGVDPGTWLRFKARGFGAALDHFGPKLAGAWTAMTDQGVYDKAVAAANRVLRNVSGLDAEDLVQDLMSGSASGGGAARNRLFYAVGSALRKYESDVGQGLITPNHSLVKGTIEHWVRKEAISALRREQSSEVERDVGSQHLNNDARDNLLLLALQSPGGPGIEVRSIVDHHIDQYYGPNDRRIVRAFLEKISQPKYRSHEEMRKLVSRFDPTKWFKQAYNLVRKELMEEFGVSAQMLTNILGGNAKNIFQFLSERVGRDPKIRSIITQLADDIELLEPGVSRIAQDDERQHAVVQQWLERKKEREGNLESGSAIGQVLDFEKDDLSEWGQVASPFAHLTRGPVVLRVATAWLEAREPC